MIEKIKKNWLYRLLIINSLESIQNIDTLIEGLIVGAFGILFGLAGWFVFGYFGFTFSAAVAKLAFFAYLAVGLYHFVGYWKEKRYEEKQYLKRGAQIGRVVLGIILTLFVYLWILEQALYIARVFPEFRAVYGPWMLFLRALPGIIVLLIPLLGWEKLCDVTPVDEITKWWFK
jgi:hypothetical protein